MPEYGPPRNGIIFFFLVLSLATLAALTPAFDAYYDSMYTGAIDDRLETYDDLAQVREAQARWERELDGIDGDIQRVAEARPPAVRAERPAEMNLDPLLGWNQLPQEVPPRVPRDVPAEETDVHEEALEVEPPEFLDQPEGLAPEDDARDAEPPSPQGARPSPQGARPASPSPARADDAPAAADDAEPAEEASPEPAAPAEPTEEAEG